MKRFLSVLLILALMFTLIQVGIPTASAAVKAPAKPTSLKVTSISYNSIKLTWTGVTGANGYSIYRATSPAGKYSLITSITAKIYTNTKLVTGKTYYYKVKAYRKVGTAKVYGSLTSAVSAKTKTITNSSVTVYTTKTGSKYHLSGCSYLAKSKIAIKLLAAKARGLTACSKCHPPK